MKENELDAINALLGEADDKHIKQFADPLAIQELLDRNGDTSEEV